jgi:hypothetical protein
VSAGTASGGRRRVSSSPSRLLLGGLAAAAVVAGALMALAGTDGGAGASASGGPLVWKAPPRVSTAPGMPRDRILSGVVRNDSARIAEVEAGEVRVLSGGGERLPSAAIFLGSFSRGLYAASRKAEASDIERRRTGRLLRIGPGGEQALTVSWRVGDPDEPAQRIEYGSGSLPVR